MDMDTQQPSTSSGITNKSVKVKIFQKAWLRLDVFKDWLKSHEDNRKAVCAVCNKILSCGKSDLIKHSKSEVHKYNMTKSRTVNSSALLPVVQSNDALVADKVKITEIKLAAFYATHNVAFAVINDMVPLLKDIFSDSLTAENMALSRTKCTQIIINILAKRKTERLINNLLNIKFSVLLDESTSIGNDKMLAILVRYFSVENKKVITELLELVALDATDCSASQIYSAFENCFKK
jgi:hypothetical protein